MSEKRKSQDDPDGYKPQFKKLELAYEEYNKVLVKRNKEIQKIFSEIEKEIVKEYSILRNLVIFLVYKETKIDFFKADYIANRLKNIPSLDKKNFIEKLEKIISELKK
jgi:hypothetical protein